MSYLGDGKDWEFIGGLAIVGLIALILGVLCFAWWAWNHVAVAIR